MEGSLMGGLEIRELEAFLALAEELHFGRAGERLYVSQSRVSQLLRALERRVGGRLVERTSRTVRLTPLGTDFLADLRPAYAALRATVNDARAAARGVDGILRIGFQGAGDDHLMAAVELFQRRHPECSAELVEIPLADPFGPLRRAEVDAAVVLLPMGERDLVLGSVFAGQPQTLAVAGAHPLAGRAEVSVEELAEVALIGVRAPAPEYWRRAQALDVTPEGRTVRPGPEVGTLEEGLAAVAAGRGAMLLCHPTAESHRRRPVVFVPVTGIAESRLGLVWHRYRETPRVRAFARAVAATKGTGNVRSVTTEAS
ncbi:MULTISPECIES: LysR family transcriptional regulator [Nocardia]|uniref:LysR family transcriptional regulator n=1 Tax=Nocardia abscessus TaxID=120957 RepID=UPI002B4AB145|nr:LysR family transcriptional regulator [Nocardia abscessus]